MTNKNTCHQNESFFTINMSGIIECIHLLRKQKSIFSLLIMNLKNDCNRFISPLLVDDLLKQEFSLSL